MGVDDYEKRTRCAHAKSDESLFSLGVRVFTGKGELVIQDGCRLGEGHTFVISDVRSGFAWVPIDSHGAIVWTSVSTCNPSDGWGASEPVCAV